MLKTTKILAFKTVTQSLPHSELSKKFYSSIMHPSWNKASKKLKKKSSFLSLHSMTRSGTWLLPKSSQNDALNKSYSLESTLSVINSLFCLRAWQLFSISAMEKGCVKTVPFKQKCEAVDIPTYAAEYEKLMSMRSRSAKKVYNQNQWNGTISVTCAFRKGEFHSITVQYISVAANVLPYLSNTHFWGEKKPQQTKHLHSIGVIFR